MKVTDENSRIRMVWIRGSGSVHKFHGSATLDPGSNMKWLGPCSGSRWGGWTWRRRGPWCSPAWAPPPPAAVSGPPGVACPGTGSLLLSPRQQLSYPLNQSNSWKQTCLPMKVNSVFLGVPIPLKYLLYKNCVHHLCNLTCPHLVINRLHENL